MTPEMTAALAAAGSAESEIAGTTAALGAPAVDPEVAAKAEKAGKLQALKEENLGLIELALSMLEPVLPFIRQCYTPAACEKIAEAGAKVEAKYNVSIGDLFGKFQPEIMLVVALLPPSVSAFKMTRELIAAKRAAVPVPPPEAPPGTEKQGAKIVPLKGSEDVKKPDK